MVSTSKRKAVNKRILLSVDKIFDPTCQNEGFVKKIRFHYAERPLSLGGKSKKTRKKWLPIVGERVTL